MNERDLPQRADEAPTGTFRLVDVGPGRSGSVPLDEQAVLLALARVRCATLELEPALREAVERTVAATGWPAGQVWRRQGTGRYRPAGIDAAADAGRFGPVRRASASLEIGAEVDAAHDPLLGRALAASGGVEVEVPAPSAVELPDPDVAARWRMIAMAGYRSAVAVPVLAEERVEAVLEFFRDEPAPVPEPVREGLELLAAELRGAAGRERMRKAVRGAAGRARELLEELRIAKGDRRREEERLRLLARAVEPGVWEWDLDAGELRVSDGWRRLLGLPVDVAVERPGDWLERVHAEDRTELERQLLRLREAGADELLESGHRVLHADGTWLAVRLRAVALRDDLGEARQLLGTLGRKSGTAGLSGGTVLYHELTGLPSRALLGDRIRQAIRRRSRQSDALFALLSLRAEGIREVEAERGAAAARELLLAFARRLCVHLRPADTVAHAGEHEFALLLEDVSKLEEATRVAERVVRELEQPFELGDEVVRLSPHVGIVLGRSSYDGPEELLKDAAVAMRRARAEERSIQVFDFAAQRFTESALELEADLRTALERREFHLEYQPIVSLDDGRITGLEAFIRWRHPRRGMVPPSTFVPVAESSPLIHEIGAWILDRACRQIRDWTDRLGAATPPAIAINITARQLHHPELLGRVGSILERHRVDGRSLRFDISEADLMRDAAQAARILEELRELGIRVAIDDFGTGYSSLGHLHSFPAAAIKIDRSFVSSPREKQRMWGVARTIVELSRILGFEVIAEGVETREQFQYLRSIGCHQAQGYLFSGPVGPDRAEELVRDGYPLDLQAPAE